MPNFAATYPIWLEHARTTIALVDAGNVLWVIGGVGMAGLVLGWAIDQVKNPKSWR
jgi:hypothetical protein